VVVTYFRVQEGSSRDIFSGFLRHCSEGREKITNASGRKVGVSKENRSKHFHTQVTNIIACANLLGNTHT
jgi:hypothetical protein